MDEDTMEKDKQASKQAALVIWPKEQVKGCNRGMKTYVYKTNKTQGLYHLQ